MSSPGISRQDLDRINLNDRRLRPQPDGSITSQQQRLLEELTADLADMEEEFKERWYQLLERDRTAFLQEKLQLKGAVEALHRRILWRRKQIAQLHGAKIIR